MSKDLVVFGAEVLLFTPDPSTALVPLARPHPTLPSEHTSSYSLARMTMSMPQKMLMIQPTITMAVST